MHPKFFFILLLMLTIVPRVANAARNAAVQRPQSVQANLPLPQLDATAWAILEMKSGWVVAGQNQNQALPPASITKLMTNYVVFERLVSGQISLNDEVLISESAWRAEGSRMFANVNTRVALEHLLKSTIIQSGNDAAIALAEHIAGSEAAFVVLMNESARKLGLKHSHFMNSTGLPAENHYMSAGDIVRLGAAIIRQHPEFYRWYGLKEYRHNGITQYNRNKLLWRDASIDGLKTGHTEEAGFCLVASAGREKQRWLAVVLGAPSASSREDMVSQLLNFSFAAYKPIEVLRSQGGVIEVPVYAGEIEKVRLQAGGPAMLVVPTGRERDTELEFQLSPYYMAPIAAGQAMGVAQLRLDQTHLADVPLIAMSSIAAGSWWQRFKDGLRLRFLDAVTPPELVYD